jgi:uncharacterized protein YbaR (Trm112 family)
MGHKHPIRAFIDLDTPTKMKAMSLHLAKARKAVEEIKEIEDNLRTNGATAEVMNMSMADTASLAALASSETANAIAILKRMKIDVEDYMEKEAKGVAIAGITMERDEEDSPAEATDDHVPSPQRVPDVPPDSPPAEAARTGNSASETGTCTANGAEQSDAIKFSCRKCSQHIEVPGDMAGKMLQCPACGSDVNVPGCRDEGLQTLVCPYCKTSLESEGFMQSEKVECPQCHRQFKEEDGYPMVDNPKTERRDI